MRYRCVAIRRSRLSAAFFFVAAGALVWQAGGAFADDGPLAKRVAELDTNGDGSLQRDEVPFGEYFFKLADRDGDGAVSVAEASAFAPVARARKKVASNNADGIRKKFGQADTDGDGVVTREEFPAADELFQRFDRDGDGKVVFAEALAFAVEEEISKVFAEGDLDLSGTLTQDEMKDDDAKLVLSAADLDRDGQVTGKEAFDFVYHARLEAIVSGEATGEASGPTSPTAAPSKGLGVLGLVIASFDEDDVDGDGALSPREFLASPELFALMDIDRDGALTQDELQIRMGFAKELGERGKKLRAQIAGLGMERELALAGAEVKAVFAAGRYEDVRRLIDRIELRIARKRAGK